MKDKIIEILQKEQFNITDEAGNAYNVVEEDDFKDIAEKIVKLFAIPVVVGQSEQLPPQICYKTNEPCKHNCSGLCKESC